MTKLEQRIAQVAEAVGYPVMVGRQGHKDEWFAHCNGTEIAASSAWNALRDLVSILKERTRQETQAAAAAARRQKAVEDL